MINLGIKGRILLLALIPVTGIALVLSTYFIHSQLQSLDYALNNHGQALARHLASASEYAVFSGNREILEALAKQALSEGDVVTIIITDKRGATLLDFHNKLAETDNDERQKVRIFSQPIIQQIITNLDEDEAFYTKKDSANPTQEILGWVAVKLSLEALQTEKNESIINSVLITFLGIVLSLLLATRLGRGLTRPLLKLHRAAEEIQRGNLDVHIKQESTGEMRTLEEGFQSMATALRKSRKNLQQQIDRATAGLHESIQTVEQQNTELKQARQKALAASEAKSVFLANMSHELRTPLNGILGFTRLIQKTHLSSEQQDYIETIEKSADNLLHLLNDILDISKIEAGKLTLQKSFCNLRSTIDDALSLLAPAAQDKGIELISLFYQDVPETLFTAADRIRQIMLNLIGNAIKFSPAGFIVIRTMLEEETDESVLIRISVTDQGIGISAENQKRLFHSFEQLDDSMARQYKGAGLGLAISRSLAELLGGVIGVDSREGDGATFWFTIRCHKLQRKQDDQTPMPQFSGYSVGIYDPNETSSLSLMHMLKTSNLNVYPHQHPETLLRQIASGPKIDIVIMATSLDSQDTEFLQSLLSKRQHKSDFNIILLVNSVDPVTLLFVHQQYGCLCIPKPLRKQEIISALESLLSPHSPQQTAETLADNNAIDSLSGYKILVVEDNEINAKLVAHILSQAGASVSLTENGQEAIDSYRNTPFDAILMDIHMPVMNGIQAAQWIRSQEADDEHIPIIGLTASLLDTDRERYFQAGIDAMLVKPADNEHLIALIRKLCTQPESSAMTCIMTPPSVDAGTDTPPPIQTSLTSMLIKEIPDVRAKMQTISTAEDWQQLQEVSHKFFGGLGYCDAKELRAAASRLHRCLISREHSTIAGTLADVFMEMDRLLAAHKNDRT
ncbi:MAG TPA: response regulator [Gammaproteobacteria bacterium]|nr:response regulator [Gammaproteobacteria bacterium]